MDIKKKIVTMRVVRHWMTIEVVDAPPLKVFEVKWQLKGQGFEQPVLLKVVPAYGRWTGLNNLYLQSKFFHLRIHMIL